MFSSKYFLISAQVAAETGFIRTFLFMFDEVSGLSSEPGLESEEVVAVAGFSTSFEDSELGVRDCEPLFDGWWWW